MPRPGVIPITNFEFTTERQIEFNLRLEAKKRADALFKSTLQSMQAQKPANKTR
jgi:hypothetical protein